MAAAILLLGTLPRRLRAASWSSAGSPPRHAGSRSWFEDQLGIVANTAGLIVIIWWVMSLAIAVAAALLDRLGRTRAAAATGRFSPAFMRRLALAAVGLQLLTAPLATRGHCACRPGPGPRPRPADGSGVGILDSVARCRPRRRRHTARPPVPRVDPRWRPLSPVVEPGPLAARHVRAQDIPGARREVTVRSGDSLWSIAAARAGAVRLRRRHRPGVAPALPGQPGRHRSRPALPAARPGPGPPAAALGTAAPRPAARRPSRRPPSPGQASRRFASTSTSHQPPHQPSAKEPS